MLRDTDTPTVVVIVTVFVKVRPIDRVLVRKGVATAPSRFGVCERDRDSELEHVSVTLTVTVSVRVTVSVMKVVFICAAAPVIKSER